MKLHHFFKDKLTFILISLFVTLFSGFLLYMVEANIYFAVFTPMLYIVGCFISILSEYFSKRSFYKDLQSSIDSLEKKSLIAEIIEPPSFTEGLFLYDTLKIACKSMNDEIKDYRLISAEYREYIELWVHEIKTPIAGARLISENAHNTAMIGELDKIDNYVEQALYHSRSNNVEKDFIIKTVLLKELVNTSIKRTAKAFISNGVAIKADDMNFNVNADIKWLDFILRQIFDNSIKYKATVLSFSSQQNQNSVTLTIHDNGIGISQKDIGRIFEKGFTGENGRNFNKSTGMGLYLCKKLCDKLGLSITASSCISDTNESGTSISIVFPKSSMYQ